MRQGDNIKLKIRNLRLSFGGVKALEDVSISVGEGELLAIIGPNGAGKTCLLNCISGFYHAQGGEIHFEGRSINGLPSHKIGALGIARTFQNTALYTGMSTLDNLMTARHIFIKPGFLLNALYYGPALKAEVRQRVVVEEIIDFLEIGYIRDQIVGTLPYGLRKRVELGRALALEPKILLLDEPVAGMNVEEKEVIVRSFLDIQEQKGVTIVLIEHDIGMVMDIANRVVVLDFGRKIAEGLPEKIAIDPMVVKAYIGEPEKIVSS
jgi:branched-chain amino acid transport system ATP-binding protein